MFCFPFISKNEIGLSATDCSLKKYWENVNIGEKKYILYIFIYLIVNVLKEMKFIDRIEILFDRIVLFFVFIIPFICLFKCSVNLWKVLGIFLPTYMIFRITPVKSAKPTIIYCPRYYDVGNTFPPLQFSASIYVQVIET